MTAKKTTSRKPGSGGSISEAKLVRNWESFDSRIFEVRRKKIEFDLDTQVTQSLEKCRDYLQQVHDRTPNMNGIVEAIILEGLANNKEFQKWLDDQERKASKERDELFDEEEKKSLNSVGTSSVPGQQKVGVGGPVTV